jgi:hypothetical protein
MAYNGPAAGVINIIPRTNSGSGVYVPVTPSADIGGDGDFAFDQNTNTLYGPKDSTQTNPWPVSGLSIGNGRYTWRAAWSSSNSYNAGDIVHYNAEQFVCIKTLDYGSPVAWTAQAYTAGSYVTYSSVLYVAVVDAVSGDVPGTATSVWKQATPDIDSANYAYAAQGNFLRLSSSIQAETTLSSSSGTMRLAVAKNSLLYGAYPIAPQGIQTGSTFPNYIVDSQAVDASSSLELSTTDFLTPAWNSGGGGATVEVKASGVTTAKIADRNVTNIKLANTAGSEAVSTGVIRDSAVTTAKLADSSVTSAKIVNGTIDTADIANDAITQPLLASSAVGEGNISPYITTGTSSPSAYVAASKLVSASTTVSGTSISTTNAAVDAQALRNGLNGWSVPNGQPLPNANRSAASNSVYLTRFYAPTAITANKISVYVNSASATSTDWFDIGIFSTAGTLLASTGQTTGINVTGTIIATLGAGTGAKTGSANYALTAGTTYYIGIMTSLTSGTVSYSGVGGFSGSTLYGTANGQWMFDSRTATGTTTSINAATISWPTVTSIATGSTVLFVLRTD